MIQNLLLSGALRRFDLDLVRSSFSRLGNPHGQDAVAQLGLSGMRVEVIWAV
jgi:hypothetical protein